MKLRFGDCLIRGSLRRAAFDAPLVLVGDVHGRTNVAGDGRCKGSYKLTEEVPLGYAGSDGLTVSTRVI